MAKVLIIATKRYSINACDFDLLFRKSKHEIVNVLYHSSIARKKWFTQPNCCPGNRSGMYTNLTQHPHQAWDRSTELQRKIEKLEFDYICLGNGNDDTGKWLRNKFQSSKFLFSEYGWMPWNETAFIDDQGTGPLSSIRYMQLSDMKVDKDRSDEISHITKQMDVGKSVEMTDFIYVPLQVDTPMSDGKPDFKFRFTGFNNNQQFLKTIAKIVPKNIKILVKNHPATRKPTPIPPPMIDISKLGLNKYEIYQKMKAMVVINSTSVMEAMLFNKNIFTYGEDVFSGKNLTYESITDPNKFSALLKTDTNEQSNKKFIYTLLQRQINRLRCKDQDYIDSHYWNNNLSSQSSRSTRLI